MIVLIITSPFLEFASAQNSPLITLPLLSISRNASACLLDTSESMSVREMLKSEVLAAVKSSMQISKCGEGLWHKIAHLNMSDPNEHCPSVWKEYTAPVRTCGRQVSSVWSCPSNTYSSYGYKYQGRIGGGGHGGQMTPPSA